MSIIPSHYQLTPHIVGGCSRTGIDSVCTFFTIYPLDYGVTGLVAYLARTLNSYAEIFSDSHFGNFQKNLMLGVQVIYIAMTHYDSPKNWPQQVATVLVPVVAHKITHSDLFTLTLSASQAIPLAEAIFEEAMQSLYSSSKKYELSALFRMSMRSAIMVVELSDTPLIKMVAALFAGGFLGQLILEGTALHALYTGSAKVRKFLENWWILPKPDRLGGQGSVRTDLVN